MAAGAAADVAEACSGADGHASLGVAAVEHAGVPVRARTGHPRLAAVVLVVAGEDQRREQAEQRDAVTAERGTHHAMEASPKPARARSPSSPTKRLAPTGAHIQPSPVAGTPSWTAASPTQRLSPGGAALTAGRGSATTFHASGTRARTARRSAFGSLEIRTGQLARRRALGRAAARRTAPRPGRPEPWRGPATPRGEARAGPGACMKKPGRPLLKRSAAFSPPRLPCFRRQTWYSVRRNRRVTAECHPG